MSFIFFGLFTFSSQGSNFLLIWENADVVQGEVGAVIPPVCLESALGLPLAAHTAPLGNITEDNHLSWILSVRTSKSSYLWCLRSSDTLSTAEPKDLAEKTHFSCLYLQLFQWRTPACEHRRGLDPILSSKLKTAFFHSSSQCYHQTNKTLHRKCHQMWENTFHFHDRRPSSKPSTPLNICEQWKNKTCFFLTCFATLCQYT